MTPGKSAHPSRLDAEQDAARCGSFMLNSPARMTASASLSVFHQWLLADPGNTASACAIVLHGDKSTPDDRLVLEIAEYLNEYDDDGDGRWLPATPELIERISGDPGHRRLLGIEETEASPSEMGRTETSMILTALGQRGHVVFHSPDSSGEVLELANTFHAGVCPTCGNPAKCHLILNPDLLDQKCMAHIIGDVFLEWLHCQMRPTTPIHEIR